MVMLNNSGQKSAFQQAYDQNPKKDYISLVTNSIPLDVKSEMIDHEGGFSDDANIRNRSGGMDHMATIQPRHQSLDNDGDDDAYPYSSPSPAITKPHISASGRFVSEYGTDNEIEKVAVQNLSAQSIKGAQM